MKVYVVMTRMDQFSKLDSIFKSKEEAEARKELLDELFFYDDYITVVVEYKVQ